MAWCRPIGSMLPVLPPLLPVRRVIIQRKMQPFAVLVSWALFPNQKHLNASLAPLASIRLTARRPNVMTAMQVASLRYKQLRTAIRAWWGGIVWQGPSLASIAVLVDLIQ